MDLLSDILSRLQLSGTLYFRTSFTSPWSIRVPDYQKVARFHFVHKGRCLVRIHSKEPPIPLEQGDLIIITRGAAHTLFCDPATEEPAALLETVIEQSGFDGSGALVYGELGTHHETQLICGHFAFEKEAKNLLIDSLPPHIHIKNYGEEAGGWMESTLKVIGSETVREKMGSNLIALKLSEIIFTQAIRTYLETLHEDIPVLSGFADRNISRALAVIHDNPGNSWTLEQLADVAGMSRTSFANRFSQRMSITPLGYLTYWRMQIARQQLATTDEPIISVSETVGYKSEAAFSRVFKKHIGLAPASYRREIRNSV